MDVTALTAAVTEILQDPSFTDPAILGHINQACLEIAGDFLLPDLIKEGEVVFDPTSKLRSCMVVAMPADFQHDIFDIWNATADKSVDLRMTVNGLVKFYEGQLATTGDVRDVAVEGTRLFGLRVPAANQTVKFMYYSQPTALVNPTDEPDFIPPHLHEPLIVNHVLKRCYKTIEDGVEGQKVNTNYYDGALSIALARLEYIYPRNEQPKSRPKIKRYPRFF